MLDFDQTLPNKTRTLLCRQIATIESFTLAFFWISERNTASPHPIQRVPVEVWG
jgi:hypothetical protein